MTARRLVGSLLVVLGCVAALISGVSLLRPAWLQEMYTTVVPAIAKPQTSDTGSHSASALRLGQPIGVLEIPRLGLSSVVIEGDDTAALLLGVGHLSDTPMPGGAGNSVFAAHRDTFFRSLARIRPRDVIRFTTKDAELKYLVQDTTIVEPTDVSVLEPTSTSTLTLITCYPFDYIGPAPRRFIVRAARV